jgi:hypothetical protein
MIRMEKRDFREALPFQNAVHWSLLLAPSNQSGSVHLAWHRISNHRVNVLCLIGRATT